MRIMRTQCNHITNPLGFDLGKHPTLSWVVEDAIGTTAEASRVVVTCVGEVVVDTGWATLDSKACTIDVPLRPHTRYEWRVSVRSDAGEEATSDVSWFETAKMDEPWEAAWITCDYAEPRHPVFSRKLPLERNDVASVRLYICGLGLYEATIDGVKVGSEHLAPGTHAYDKWLQYQTYDVTGLVKDGAMLAVALGHGWYSGRFGFVLSDEGYYGGDWRLIAELRVTYADGSEQVIGTDESWQVTRTNIAFSNIYDGERIDDTLPPVAPVAATLLDGEAADAVTGMLHARLSLPVTAHETIVPTLLTTPAGECVLDLGQEITGTFRLRVELPSGATLRVQTAEILQDGNFYRDNLRTALSEFWYVSDGEPREVGPIFTFYGYRYAKVTIDGKAPASFDPTTFTAIVLHSDFETERGRIVTGHAKVNRLIANARWGMRDNFLDTPTDCPQRDERMGWTGDANVFSKTALLMGAPYAFYRKYLHDMALEQEAAGGAMPLVVPSYGLIGAPAVWGDATTMIPWNAFLAEGDPSILAEHFEAMRAYVDWCVSQDGDDHALERSRQLGDWLALDSKDPAGREGYTDGGLIAYLYLWRSACIVGMAARVLGRAEEAKLYNELADSVRDWVETCYYTATGRCAVNTMCAYVLSLAFGFGSPEWSEAQLLKMLKEEGGLTTGFVGTPLLCPVLSECGHDREAYDLLTKEDYPSWLYCVNLGATTIWERWNSLDAEGHITGTEMNSLNHYSYGAIVEWLFSWAAGLRPIEPGFASAVIDPRPGWRLRTLTMELDSAAGTWRVSWACVDEHHLHLEITVPFGATAEVRLPLATDAAYEALGGHLLAAGTYEVTYETLAPLRRVPSVDWTLEAILDAPDACTVVREYVDGFDWAAMNADHGLTLRELQVQGFGQNRVMSEGELEACDAALYALAD